ncbi:IS5 family transposase [Rubrivirga sp. S365]|uniref:IS5 family transposase n=1 Tax=Rubrivirga litoralis TaxID=3075598 RepID=A0ABU3BN59_9BACT|nr:MULTISPECIES: IS5 family transposase [unclassified Rubrivirga]MDT0630712.1 IS5 family transposase [Rubrivirga sp. F394]MDT7856284.1 IS5 family transposase [Rubrivirga sp. S365]
MPRHTLSDAQFNRIRHLLPGKPGDRGRTATNNKLFLEAVLFVASNGGRWRDLPERFGKWNSVFVRFNRWSKRGVWQRLFESVQDPDLEWLMVDSTILRVHQDAAAAKKGGPSELANHREGFGHSRGGLTTKLHVACDALCNPVRFALTGGQAPDGHEMLPLIAGLDAGAVLADAAYDSDAHRAALSAGGIGAVIKPNGARSAKPPFDREVYRERNQVERLIGRLKRYRRIGTRYEQTARNDLSVVHAVSTLILLA